MQLNKKHYWFRAIINDPTLFKWYFHWKSSLNGRRSALVDRLPWMTYGAIDWLSKNLCNDMSLFEWGSGGSTLFFSDRVRQVVAIEHDADWYNAVSQLLIRKSIKNVSINLVQPKRVSQIDEIYTSTSAEYVNHSFEEYVKMIDGYPDNYFDIVVVDGRARSGCMKHAIRKIKVGGYLLLDNSERLAYRDGCMLVENWKNTKIWGPGPYNSYPWETRIWKRGM